MTCSFNPWKGSIHFKAGNINWKRTSNLTIINYTNGLYTNFWCWYCATQRDGKWWWKSKKSESSRSITVGSLNTLLEFTIHMSITCIHAMDISIWIYQVNLNSKSCHLLKNKKLRLFHLFLSLGVWPSHMLLRE